MSKLKLIIVAVIASFVMSSIFSLLPPVERPQPAIAAPAATFDHSNCQYPNRWSNPVDGCDNTDPAVPECVGKMSTEKEERDCIDAFVKQHQTPAEPNKPVDSKNQSIPARVCNDPTI